MMNPMLNIQEKTPVDDSIVSYQTFSFLPITGTQLNTAGQIVIRVENSDNFYRPSDSWIQFEGKVTKEDATAYARTDLISIANNGILHLFDNIKYELSGREIETVYHPGQAMTMLGLLKHPSTYNSGGGLNAGWVMDDGDGTAALATNPGFKIRQNYLLNNVPGAEVDPNSGSFRFAIRLDELFGFADDYKKVLYGFIHTITLVRNMSNNNALFRAAAADDGKIEFTRISWHLPRVVPADVTKYELLKLIKDQAVLSVDFRMRQCITTTVPVSTSFFWRVGLRSSPEKPRFLIVGFQTARENDQEKNLSLFDHCNLINAYVLLNNDRYPMIDFHADFAKNHYENFYMEFYQFIKKYYGINDSVTSTAVDPILYKKLYPIIVFDVTKQSERIQQGVVDITIQSFFSANVAANTTAFCLMISDRKLRFKSDGNKMNVLF